MMTILRNFDGKRQFYFCEWIMKKYIIGNGIYDINTKRTTSIKKGFISTTITVSSSSPNGNMSAVDSYEGGNKKTNLVNAESKISNEKVIGREEDKVNIKIRPKASNFKELSPNLKVGDPLPFINIYKDGKDPIVEEDSKYPDWIWDSLISTHSPLMKDPNDIKSRKDLRAFNKYKIKLNNIKSGTNPFK